MIGTGIRTCQISGRRARGEEVDYVELTCDKSVNDKEDPASIGCREKVAVPQGKGEGVDEVDGVSVRPSFRLAEDDCPKQPEGCERHKAEDEIVETRGCILLHSKLAQKFHLGHELV